MHIIEWNWSEKQKNMQAIDITVETVEHRRTSYWGYYITWYCRPEMESVDITITLDLCDFWIGIRDGFRDHLKIKIEG